ncbi:MAG: 16S rRNA (guanine(966)-N(2))-methyltransferase RsmD [Planctomycetota bacterium]
MRIIAGSARGRKLLPVPGRDTRPLTDRVKESLFSILQPRFPESAVLDLYAGSGAFGIEAVSRGASKAVCVEKARSAFEICKRNIDALDFGDRVIAVQSDVVVWCAGASGYQNFDIVFADPPFPDVSDSRSSFFRLLPHLSNVCAEDGLLVIRTHERAKPPEVPAMKLFRVKSIGLSQLLFYEPHGSNE